MVVLGRIVLRVAREDFHTTILEQVDLSTLAIILVLAGKSTIGETVEHLWRSTCMHGVLPGGRWGVMRGLEQVLGTLGLCVSPCGQWGLGAGAGVGHAVCVSSCGPVCALLWSRTSEMPFVGFASIGLTGTPAVS